MSNYEGSKKARLITSIIYLLIMAVILGGTYRSQQQKESAAKTVQDLPVSIATPAVVSDIQVRY